MSKTPGYSFSTFTSIYYFHSLLLIQKGSSQGAQNIHAPASKTTVYIRVTQRSTLEPQTFELKGILLQKSGLQIQKYKLWCLCFT